MNRRNFNYLVGLQATFSFLTGWNFLQYKSIISRDVRIKFVITILKRIALVLGKEVIEQSVEKFIENIFDSTAPKSDLNSINSIINSYNQEYLTNVNIILPYGSQAKSFLSLYEITDTELTYPSEVLVPAYSHSSDMFKGFSLILNPPLLKGMLDLAEDLTESGNYTPSQVEDSLLPFGKSKTPFVKEKIGLNIRLWNSKLGKVAIRYDLKEDYFEGKIEFFNTMNRRDFHSKIFSGSFK